MVTLYPYPRGFVLFRSDMNPGFPENWTTVDLPASGWSMAHDNHYIPQISHVSDSDQWVLIHGLCLHSNPNIPEVAPPPAVHLAEQLGQSSSAFLNALDFLGGRYIVLCGDTTEFDVYNDATGMRSVYYSQESQIISSHVHLIHELYPHVPRTDPQGRRAITASWDNTAYMGISPLLPNHFLRSSDWSIHRFFPRKTNQYDSWRLAEKLDFFRAIWSRQMDELTAMDAELVMSITGGSDSRTSLALSVDHIDSIQFFTYTAEDTSESKWNQSLALDRTLVDQIRALVNFDHRYFDSEMRDQNAVTKLDELLSKNTAQRHSRWLVPFYCEAFPGTNVIHLRGNGYEIGRAYWGVLKNNNTKASLRRLHFQLTKANESYVTPDERIRQFEDGYEKWGYDIPLHNYHLRDIFYWEIRSGRWLSEVLNETDIAFETQVPMNVRALIDISLSMPLTERQNALLFSELINETCPILNFPGKNTTRNLYEQHRDREKDLREQQRASDTRLLGSGCGIDDNGSRAEVDKFSENEIFIPKQLFNEGYSVSRQIIVPKSTAEITFSIANEYANPHGIGKFMYEIAVEDRVEVSWDGAEHPRPVHVYVRLVEPTQSVEVRVRAIDNQKDKLSWQAATLATIDHIQFYNGPRSKKVLVAVDVPQSIHANTVD